MATLSRDLRRVLEKVVLAAREQAEAGARKALEQLAVAHREPWATMASDQQTLRRRLRARGRQLGDRLEERGKHGIEHLVAECAYEQWHRMLFARFLAECGLLIEPKSEVPVSIEECKELARAQGSDWIALASSFAQEMLPQIFRPDDAVLDITFPAEHRQPLERLLMSLPADAFLADDSLGWVYQFWQSEAKDKVNRSGKKVGADELPSVTQLFTEHYMVDFLLDNALGAWHAGRVFAATPVVSKGAQDEEELRSAVALPGCPWKYLRFTTADDGTWIPAAGSFDGWPTTAKELKCLDPCMGSGHFVVAMFERLVALRMAEEHLDPATAVVAVIRDNLFGLEIDARCTQIGAFNLALAAWRRVGYCKLPSMNIACSGLAPNAREADWLAVAGDSEKLQKGMERLYRLFKDAPVLGSLINPRAAEGDLLEAAFHELQPLLEKALAQESDDIAHEMAVTARGLAKAADILSGQFTLVATNVPYLGRPKQDDVLMDYCERVHPTAKADLATCFVERCSAFCAPKCTGALVTPQNWLFLGSYRTLREQTLRQSTWNVVARLGARAFETIGGEVVNVSLLILTLDGPREQAMILGLDVAASASPAAKSLGLVDQVIVRVSQAGQLQNPDSRFAFDEQQSGTKLLREFAGCYQGVRTGDRDRFVFPFWEVTDFIRTWEAYRNTSRSANPADGISEVLRWERGLGTLHEYAVETRDKLHDMHESGNLAWGKRGVAINQMNNLRASLFFGEKFDGNVNVVFPANEQNLSALWVFCSSPQYAKEVRRLDQKLAVTNATLLKVPFDLAYWREVAEEKYPDGLPKPFSSDPTQWLFDGHPKDSDQPLQVAVARLLGYQWPRQAGASFPDCRALMPDGLERLADADGVVCLSPTKGEARAAERLSGLLASAWGEDWNATVLEDLLAQAGYGGRTLDEWLRNGFFEQHCEAFKRRPFIWQVWDGRRDGFNALLNYHKLTKVSLEKLTYAYLGDWIRQQQAAVERGEPGSEARLASAGRLQGELRKILEGEPPYDIFVRWKPLAQQAIGWAPDLDDGVRMNIRPFLMATDVGKKGAGVLRAKPNINWEKDRGKDPFRSKDEFPWSWGWDEKTEGFCGGSTFDGNRWNDLHYSREFKMAARRRMDPV